MGIFSPPYVFAREGTLGVTIGYPLAQYPGTRALLAKVLATGTYVAHNIAAGSDSDPGGVVMSDLVITEVTAAVGRTKVLEHGYGFLISVTGSVIVHPSVDLATSTSEITLMEVEFPNGLGTPDAQNYQAHVLQQMVSGVSGSTSYTKGAHHC